jgi:hypothetical protein
MGDRLIGKFMLAREGKSGIRRLAQWRHRGG